jgi:hypothetical protein
MSGEKPGKPGTVLAFAGLGAVFIFSTILFVSDRLFAQEPFVALQKTQDVTASIAPCSFRIQKEENRIKLKGQTSTEEDHKILLGLVKANFASIYVADRIKPRSDDARTNINVGGVSFALKVLSLLDTGSASIDEKVIKLDGKAGTRALHAEVLEYIKSKQPNGITVKTSITPPSKSFYWRAKFSDGQLDIDGAITAESDRQALDNGAHELFQNVNVVNQTGIVEDLPENWADATLLSLQILRLLNSGVVEIADQSIQLEGLSPDEATLKKVEELTRQYPPGFALKSRISTPQRSGGALIDHPDATASVR